jgi:hypothetical protein
MEKNIKDGRGTNSALNSPVREHSEKSHKEQVVEDEIPPIIKDQTSNLLNKEIRIPMLDLSRNSIIISRKGSDDHNKSSKAHSGVFKPEITEDGNHNILQFPHMPGLKRSVSQDEETPSQRSKANSDETVNEDFEDSESLKSENIAEEPLDELAIETSDSLRNIPRDCMNILVKLMINQNDGVDFKISQDVVEGNAFPFNMDLLGLQSEVHFHSILIANRPKQIHSQDSSLLERTKSSRKSRLQQ